MNRFHPFPSAGRRLLAIDLLLVLWAALWIGLGVEVAREVDGLKELSSTVRTTGGAVESAGRSLQSLGSLPVVGPQLGEPAQQIQEAGRSAVLSGRSSRESIEALSVLLGLAVAVVPSLPLLVFYLPQRLARRREAGALRRLVERADDRPQLDRFLAARALQNAPLNELARVASEPWLADDADLARIERRRHGLA